MKFEIGKIMLAEQIGKIEVSVHVRETDRQQANQSATVTVYLDFKDYSISELKAAAAKAAKDFLAKAVE